MEGGGEKEYYLASAGGEVFVPPSAQFALKGFSVQGMAAFAVHVFSDLSTNRHSHLDNDLQPASASMYIGCCRMQLPQAMPTATC